MDDKLFLIAIGGTGMRCLESFVHLCAAGMFDNRTIEILTLDTDQNNGNKTRVEDLIELYNKVKTNDATNKGGAPRNNTFFSAKLNLYRFFTDYSKPGRMTLSALCRTNNLNQVDSADNQDLTDLFYDAETVQDFKLDHGYRAQTHLGSMLMYHGIIEAAASVKRGQNVKQQEKELYDFLELLSQNAAHARVFVFGSVFGGTGASSIPVIPLAISEALTIIKGGTHQLNLNSVLFGSTLLTDYFTFGTPTQEQIGHDRVVADAKNFALNSQAALSFYEEDPSVRNTYKRMYHIGWPTKVNYSSGREGDVITGGALQRNACHIAELMSACAAYDFFTTPRDVLENITNAEYVFRTVETDDHGNLILSGKSFVGEKDGVKFENKLGALLSLAHVILSKFHGAEEGQRGTKRLLDYLDDAAFKEYNVLEDAQADEIDNYLKEFAYKFLNGNVEFGWIYQINKSVEPGKFIFTSEAFKTDIQSLKNIDPGMVLADPRYHWQKKGSIFSSDADRRFNTFITIVKNPDTLPADSQGVTLKERFLAHLYNAITDAQNFTE